MELITTHTHTNFCGHAFEPIEDMVGAAHAAGITTMAITEHYPLNDPWDLGGYISMPKKRVGEYLNEIERQQELHPEMEIICGCELDWLGKDDDRDLTSKDFEKFAVVLGSVHHIDGWAIDNKQAQGHWDEVGVDNLWKRYYELWCDAVISSPHFTIMAHPDLIKKYRRRPSFNPQPLYEQAAEAAHESGRMIEINTSGYDYLCLEAFPGPAALRAFARANVPCTIGTDAHASRDVARHLDRGYKALVEAGYQNLTVPTKDGDRRIVPIE